MYIPPHFEQPNIEVMRELIRSDRLPRWLLSAQVALMPITFRCIFTTPEPFVRLRGHVLVQIQSGTTWHRILTRWLYFTGRMLISARLGMRPAGDGKGCSHMNYTVVHAYGSLRIIDDALGFVPRWRPSPRITRRLFQSRGQCRMRRRILPKS